MVAQIGLSFQVPILEEQAGKLHAYPYLLGGVSGNDYLVTALGAIKAVRALSLLNSGSELALPKNMSYFLTPIKPWGREGAKPD